MLCVGKNIGHRALLHNLPGIHDGYALSMVRNNAQIVCDEKHGHARVFLQSGHEIQNLSLNGDIQCRRGFIGNQQLRLANHGHGNHDALPHSARKLVGVLVKPLLGCGNFNLFQSSHGAGICG
jgi:hypothetical protein